jgi:hypothetical protein
MRILDMFNPGVLHWVEGAGIGRSYNAFNLSVGLHRRFRILKIHFEAASSIEHTYTIKKTPLFQVFGFGFLSLENSLLLLTTPLSLLWCAFLQSIELLSNNLEWCRRPHR